MHFFKVLEVHVTINQLILWIFKYLLKRLIYSFVWYLYLFNEPVPNVLSILRNILYLKAVWWQDLKYLESLAIKPLHSNHLFKHNNIILVKSMMLFVLCINNALWSNSGYQRHHFRLSVWVCNDVVESIICKYMSKHPWYCNRNKAFV